MQEGLDVLSDPGLIKWFKLQWRQSAIHVLYADTETVRSQYKELKVINVCGSISVLLLCFQHR